jgi:hypothetical protein
MGVGVEAGLATAADAERFVALPNCHRVFRVLIEIGQQKSDEADEVSRTESRAFSRVRMSGGRSSCTATTRPYGILSSARGRSAGRRVSGWRMDTISPMVSLQWQTPSWSRMLSRYFVPALIVSPAPRSARRLPTRRCHRLPRAACR